MQTKTQERIDTACRVILPGRPTTRNFNSCFENADSHQVGAGVWKRALKNPKIMAALPRYLVADYCRRDYEAENIAEEKHNAPSR